MAVLALATPMAPMCIAQPGAADASVSPFVACSSAFSGAPVPGSIVLSRADAWVQANVPYSQTSCYQGFRQDCSGFVSMAWELPSSLITTEFNPKYNGGDSRFPPISPSQLVPGDALVYDASANPGDSGEHHIALFTGWSADDNGSHRYANIAQEADTALGTIGTTDNDLAGSYWGSFQPIHYTGLRSPVATNGGWFTRPSSSSWSGVRVGSDGRAYQSVYSGAGWHTYPIDGGLSGTPTLVYANGETDFFGLAPSGDLWQDRYVNSGWTGWYRDTGVTFKAGTGISAIYADGMYQVFGVGPSGTMYRSYYSGGWHSQSLGGNLTGTPGVTYVDGRYDVFALAPSGQLYQNINRTGTWEGWNPDGTVQYRVGTGVSALYADGMYRVYGVGPSGVLYQAYYASGWHSQDLGGNITGTPTATYLNGRYDVFALSLSGDLWQLNRPDGGTWGTWAPEAAAV